MVGKVNCKEVAITDHLTLSLYQTHTHSHKLSLTLFLSSFSLSSISLTIYLYLSLFLSVSITSRLSHSHKIEMIFSFNPYKDRVPSFYYLLKTYYSYLMQIWQQLFIVLRQPAAISVTVFSNPTKLTNYLFIFFVSRVGVVVVAACWLVLSLMMLRCYQLI